MLSAEVKVPLLTMIALVLLYEVSSGDDEASISVNYPPPKVKKEAKNLV